MADPRKLFHLGFEVMALVAYHIPRWLVSATKIWLYEDKKGNWTLVRHMRVQMKRHMPSVWQRSGIPRPPNPDHTAAQGPGGVWIPVVPEDLIVGEINTFARDRNIASISIPGYWIHKDEKLPFESPPFPGEKIFYLCHGGGYVTETAHPKGAASTILKDFLRNSSSLSLRRTFAIEYRLCSPGEPGKGSVFPFPTALIDALVGYLYLIKLGFSEEDIIIIGDSAGGNLALALTRYLLSNKEQQPKLPRIPSALVLLSPWTDLSSQFVDNPGPQSSLTINAERDWLVPINSGYVRSSAEVFLGGRPEHIELAYRNPYISPASPVLLGLTPDSPTRTISFKGFPKTFIDNGGFESFCDQIRLLGDAMVEDLGEEAVAYNEVDGATHDYLTVDWHDPDRTDTSKKILKWLGL
ncbi:alpha/beta-hydrolase [Thelephora ganbajun]|uniref:Alpha/beta-hydrolase n=1 Tax=Thelephora ganbajun TaxID=370292 RepID=A0ACB6ZFT3_THEGA|nr:alpha/beta-hydrolase [Thelephora ganbajun]